MLCKQILIHHQYASSQAFFQKQYTHFIIISQDIDYMCKYHEGCIKQRLFIYPFKQDANSLNTEWIFISKFSEQSLWSKLTGKQQFPTSYSVAARTSLMNSICVMYTVIHIPMFIGIYGMAWPTNMMQIPMVNKQL